ncbi:MAG: hypothetical protein ACREI3_07010 [Nitrospirales bacterium]
MRNRRGSLSKEDVAVLWSLGLSVGAVLLSLAVLMVLWWAR